jgi:hypothetical protein
MNQLHLDAIQQWFDSYVRTYDDIDAEGLKNIHLKVEHTRKVCEVMELLTGGEGLSPEDARIAAATALLHDVGRFPQYRRWRTFRDSDSDNHARLSVEVTRSEGILDDLPPSERMLIEEAVRFHNLLEIPARLQSPTALFLKLIRDADKLDIWRVFLDFFHQPPEKRASAAGLGFLDLPEVSAACVDRLHSGQIVHLDTVRTLNDFILLQISWAYDLNFPTSYRLLSERGYIGALAASLPADAKINRAVQQTMDLIDLHIHG